MRSPFTFLSALLLAALLAPAAARAQAPAMKPGVTAWIYDTGEPMTQLPILVAGQTPNYSDDHPQIDFSAPWPSDTGPLAQNFVGLVWGKIKVATAGSHQFRVTSDDGAQLFIDDALVVNSDAANQFGERTGAGTVTLSAGSHPFKLRFFQNASAFRLRVEWKAPGAADFAVVPSSALETEEGQTHVVSPGLKRFYYESGGGQAGGPGDGRPLEGVHPSYTLGNFRPFGFQPRIGGMDFLPDGRLVVCTWDPVGAVYILGNVNGPAASVTVTRFAEGLGEPLGVRVVGGDIYVTQKGEVTRLRDTDGDGIADEYESVARGWPASHNYHEFTFNLAHRDGFFYVTTSVPLKTGDTMYMPTTIPAGEDSYSVPNGPGSLIKIDPAQRTWEIIARGLRTPNGLGVGPTGEFFVGENQGAWMPSSKLNALRPGGFYGHQTAFAGTTPTNAPALWLPHGEISNSPAEPTVIPTGTYAGQMLFAELTHGGVNRAALETINGQTQGAVFQFTQGLESGMNRVAWSPEGSLYLGGLGSGGNWNWEGTLFGLQKLTYNQRPTFEMKSVRSRADGFEIEMTYQVPFPVLADPANYLIQRWSYAPSAAYGGSKQGLATLTPSEISVSQDRRKVFLKLPGLQANRVVYFRLRNFLSDSPVPVAPWSTEAWYTLNAIGASSGPAFTPVPAVPVGSSNGTSIEQQAEAAAGANVTVEANNAGFTGTGFVNFPVSGAAHVEFSVNVPSAGSHVLSFRYALGATASRSLSLSINGGAAETVSFPITGAWTTWADLALSRPLVAGLNTIRLSTSADGPNLDRLNVTGASTGGAIGPGALFTSWAQPFGITLAQINDDPDADGASTLLEYFAGGDPTVSQRETAGHPLEPQFTHLAGGFVEITYRRRIDYLARGLSNVIQSSGTLASGSWSPLPAIQIGEAVPSGDGWTELVTVRSTVAVGPGPFFCRNRVTMGN